MKANWKLIFENNRECYHCNHAHPEYVQGTYDTARFSPQTLPEVERQEQHRGERFARMGLGDAMASSEMTGAYWRAARTPLVEGWKTQSLDGQPVAPLMGTFRARNEWSDGTLRSTIFPNFWQHASDDHAVSTRITPIDATTCQVDVYWFVHKDAVEGQDYDLAETDAVLAANLRAGLGNLRGEPGRHPVAALSARAVLDGARDQRAALRRLVSRRARRPARRA